MISAIIFQQKLAEDDCKMKKEIGSIFPLSDEILKQAESEQIEYSDDRVYYSLCREALYDIATDLKGSNKKVLIPAYTCQTVITPFEEAGWQCEYYSIDKNLRIVSSSLFEAVEKYHPSLVVVHPYFGKDLNDEEIELLQEINRKGIEIILDLTQCIFTKKKYSFASYIVGSYRKWFPIPDGGFLKCNTKKKSIFQPERENSQFTEKEIDAMYLRDQYFCNGEKRTKDISIRLSKEADHIAECNVIPHRMSQIAYNLLQKEDVEENQNRRRCNYSFLFHEIRDNYQVRKVCRDLNEVTTAPLYFTIYVQDRSFLQRLLAQDAIYAPVLWPVEDKRVLINDEVKYIYDHLLAIPCDQRYETNDMKRVIAIINSY